MRRIKHGVKTGPKAEEKKIKDLKMCSECHARRKVVVEEEDVGGRVSCIHECIVPRAVRRLAQHTPQGTAKLSCQSLLPPLPLGDKRQTGNAKGGKNE